MPFTISPEQLSFFRAHHSLILENLMTPKQATALISAIENVRSKSPGYVEENFFRSIPDIATLARKRGWGTLAYELIHKKPLRIGYDAFFPTLPPQQLVEEGGCGLILSLATCAGLFFVGSSPLKNAFLNEHDPGSGYFFLVFTTKYLPEPINPIIVQ